MGRRRAGRAGELREALHETEARILRIIRELRDGGVVKRLGLNRQARYALTTWEPAEQEVAPRPISPSITPRVQPPATSWWLDRDRAAFNQQLQQELQRMTRSGLGSTVKPMTVGEI